MTFNEEEARYERTILSDLQGAWGCLRESVVQSFGFEGSDRALFHIDEAMSWESVRNLKKMESTLLLIQNITAQTESPEEVIEWLNDVRSSYKEAMEAIIEGRAE